MCSGHWQFPCNCNRGAVLPLLHRTYGQVSPLVFVDFLTPCNLTSKVVSYFCWVLILLDAAIFVAWLLIKMCVFVCVCACVYSALIFLYH